ncbi:hypothetical protein LF41_1057 [Lysobacter dokdonensis DS-58]|uniref:Uncharacterized protein n=1 Tax=Lysobacter dokdonensis DS-58 TaxID=1300345 RepID=A0A0A2WQF1_9GAMM|nr:hypothetical protein [Lysobacter dokdonensis]KGQ20520.1 hypothetical protein LF41_1057 [Lysobacter dokdonensis DS-58]
MQQLDARTDFVCASDHALKSLRAVFLMTGRSPDEAVRHAAHVVATLLDHGGAGWIERLIESQASAQLREMARLAAEDCAADDNCAKTRAQTLLVCLARQALAAEVFDAVAARTR